MMAASNRPNGTGGGSSQGPSVDRAGAPVIDPTENVKAILEAAVKRLDDLRTVEIASLRSEMALRSDFYAELRHAETARIDAIRAVDVGAVAAAAQVSATQASTLAAQVALSADAMRTQVAAAAQAQTESQSRLLDPIQKDIADLRRAQYEQQGQKQQVVEGRDSAADMRPILDAIAALQITAQQNTGARDHVVQRRQSNTLLLAVGGFVVTVMFLIMTALSIYLATKGTGTTAGTVK